MADIVVVDTNQITSVDWHLEKQLWRRLLQLARRGDVRVIVPEIVVAETVGKFRRESATAARQLRMLHLDAPDAAAAADRYEQSLRETLSSAGAEIPSPVIDVIGLVDRATARKAPFDDQGRNFRDSAIWMHVLHEAGHGSVALISTDGDFYVSKSDELRDALIAEAAPGQVMAFKSISSFLAHIGRDPIDATLGGRIRASLADADRYLDLTDEIATLALREAVPVDEDGWRVTISRVHPIDSIEPVGIRSSDEADEEVVVELLAMADASVVVEYHDGDVTVRNTSGAVHDLMLAIDARFTDPDLHIESVAALPVRGNDLVFASPPSVGDNRPLSGLDEQSARIISEHLRAARPSSTDWNSVAAGIAEQLAPTQQALQAWRAELDEQFGPRSEVLRAWAEQIGEQVKPTDKALQVWATQLSEQLQPVSILAAQLSRAIEDQLGPVIAQAAANARKDAAMTDGDSVGAEPPTDDDSEQ